MNSKRNLMAPSHSCHPERPAKIHRSEVPMVVAEPEIQGELMAAFHWPVVENLQLVVHCEEPQPMEEDDESFSLSPSQEEDLMQIDEEFLEVMDWEDSMDGEGSSYSPSPDPPLSIGWLPVPAVEEYGDLMDFEEDYRITIGSDSVGDDEMGEVDVDDHHESGWPTWTEADVDVDDDHQESGWPTWPVEEVEVDAGHREGWGSWD